MAKYLQDPSLVLSSIYANDEPTNTAVIPTKTVSFGRGPTLQGVNNAYYDALSRPSEVLVMEEEEPLGEALGRDSLHYGGTQQRGAMMTNLHSSSSRQPSRNAQQPMSPVQLNTIGDKYMVNDAKRAAQQHPSRSGQRPPSVHNVDAGNPQSILLSRGGTPVRSHNVSRQASEQQQPPVTQTQAQPTSVSMTNIGGLNDTSFSMYIPIDSPMPVYQAAPRPRSVTFVNGEESGRNPANLTDVSISSQVREVRPSRAISEEIAQQPPVRAVSASYANASHHGTPMKSKSIGQQDSPIPKPQRMPSNASDNNMTPRKRSLPGLATPKKGNSPVPGSKNQAPSPYVRSVSEEVNMLMQRADRDASLARHLAEDVPQKEEKEKEELPQERTSDRLSTNLMMAAPKSKATDLHQLSQTYEDRSKFRSSKSKSHGRRSRSRSAARRELSVMSLPEIEDSVSFVAYIDETRAQMEEEKEKTKPQRSHQQSAKNKHYRDEKKHKSSHRRQERSVEYTSTDYESSEVEEVPYHHRGQRHQSELRRKHSKKELQPQDFDYRRPQQYKKAQASHAVADRLKYQRRELQKRGGKGGGRYVEEEESQDQEDLVSQAEQEYRGKYSLPSVATAAQRKVAAAPLNKEQNNSRKRPRNLTFLDEEDDEELGNQRKKRGSAAAFGGNRSGILTSTTGQAQSIVVGQDADGPILRKGRRKPSRSKSQSLALLNSDTDGENSKAGEKPVALHRRNLNISPIASLPEEAPPVRLSRTAPAMLNSSRGGGRKAQSAAQPIMMNASYSSSNIPARRGGRRGANKACSVEAEFGLDTRFTAPQSIPSMAVLQQPKQKGGRGRGGSSNKNPFSVPLMDFNASATTLNSSSGHSATIPRGAHPSCPVVIPQSRNNNMSRQTSVSSMQPPPSVFPMNNNGTTSRNNSLSRASSMQRGGGTNNMGRQDDAFFNNFQQEEMVQEQPFDLLGSTHPKNSNPYPPQQSANHGSDDPMAAFFDAAFPRVSQVSSNLMAMAAVDPRRGMGGLGNVPMGGGMGSAYQLKAPKRTKGRW